MKMPTFLTILLSLSLFSSCALVRKSAVSTASPIFVKATEGLEQEPDLEHFKQGTPGNLMLLESLLYVSPSDKDILVSLVKGYSGYAFAIHETNYLEDLLAEEENSQAKKQALLNYSKAIKHGLSYLSLYGISFSDLERAVREEGGIPRFLEKEYDDDGRDIDAVLFLAQSLGSFINMNKTDMTLVARLGVAKGLFDWACNLNPDVNFGMCDIFYGAYEAARPRMLGGNPQKAKEIFSKAMKRWPKNWLIHVSYIQYYLIPMAEEEEYKQYKVILENAYKDFESSLLWSPSEKNENLGAPRMRIYQSLAFERFKIIKKMENDIF